MNPLRIRPLPIAIACISLALPASRCPAREVSPIIAPIAKEANNWCWAASDKMVLGFLKRNPGYVRQCDVANTRLNRSDCCSSPSLCDVVGAPTLDRYGYTMAEKSSALFFEAQLVPEILANRPFIFEWRWLDGTSHLMVGTGAEIINGNIKMVARNNSNGHGDFAWIRYDEYMGGPGYDHSIVKNYYRIK
jgi:hypothetical protein